MSALQIVSTFIRLFAVFFAVANIFGIIKIVFAQSGTPSVVAALAIFCILIVPVVLWMFSQRIAKVMLGKAAGAANTGPLSAADIFQIGCGLIGVWMIASIFPSLSVNGALALTYHTKIDPLMVTQIVQFLVGLFLVRKYLGLRI